MQWIKVDGKPSWNTWTIDDLNPKNQELYSAKPDPDPTLSTGWQVWNRKGEVWGDGDSSISITYLHGHITPTDLSVSNSSALESENQQLSKVIEALRMENESLQSTSANADVDKELLRQRNIEIRRLTVFNDSLEDEIMKMAVSRWSRPATPRSPNADLNADPVENRRSSTSFSSQSPRSPRTSLLAAAKFKAISCKLKASPIKSPPNKEKSDTSNPVNENFSDEDYGVRHTTYNDVKELIRTSKESLASYSFEKTRGESSDPTSTEKMNKMSATDKKTEITQTSSTAVSIAEKTSSIIDDIKEVVEQISSTIRQLVIPQIVEDNVPTDHFSTDNVITKTSSATVQKSSNDKKTGKGPKKDRKSSTCKVTKQRSNSQPTNSFLKVNNDSKWLRVKKSSILQLHMQRNYNGARIATYNKFRRILTVANINLTQETYNNIFSSILILTGISLMTFFNH